MLINSYRFAPAGPTDPNFANVSLLLHGNGTNGQQTPITDSSPSPKTMTAAGNAQISTAIADPFNNSTRGVLFFNNSATNRITTPSNSDLAFGVGDFTVEAWIYLLSQNPFSSLIEIGNHLNPNATIFIVGTAPALYSGSFFGTTMTSTLNAWQHVAWSRNGSTLRGYTDGTQVFSTTFGNNLTDTSLSTIGQAPVGGSSSAPYNLNGYIDDLRITKFCRYTANFPVPTAPFPDS